MSANGTQRNIGHHDDAGVRFIVINRPQRKNALDLPMRQQISDLVVAAHADPAIRAVVLTGAGATFCSGADVVGMEQQKDLAKARARVETAQQIASGPTPVIAAVEGVAFGAGLAIAVACDYIVATPDVRLSAAFVNVGLSGDAGILFSLPRRVGPARARAMMMLAQTIEGTEALQLGLVDELVEPGQALVKATAVATALADGHPWPSPPLRRRSPSRPSASRTRWKPSWDFRAPLLGSDDFLEAITAFKDKRQPTFSGT